MLINARPQPPDDLGVTLVEVVVAGLISLVVGALALSFLLTTTDGTRRADGQNEQAAAARAALDSWSRLLRVAVDPVGTSAPGTPRLVSIGPDAASLCVALDSKAGDPDADRLPIGVTLRLDDGQLVEERWSSCPAMLGGDDEPVRRVVANGVGPAGSTWLITPLAIEDVPTGVQGALLTSSLTVGDAELEVTDPAGREAITKVAALQIAFRGVPDARRPSPAGTYSTVVALAVGG